MDVEVRGAAGVGGDPNFYLHLGDGYEKRWTSVQRMQREVKSTLLLCGRQCHCKKHKTFHLGTIMLLSWNTPLSQLLCTCTHRPSTNNDRLHWFLPPSTSSSTFTSRLSGSTESVLPIPMALPAKYAERKEGSAKVGAKIRVFQNLIYKTGYSKVQSTHLTLKPKTITVLNAVGKLPEKWINDWPLGCFKSLFSSKIYPKNACQSRISVIEKYLSLN